MDTLNIPKRWLLPVLVGVIVVSSLPASAADYDDDDDNYSDGDKSSLSTADNCFSFVDPPSWCQSYKTFFLRCR